MQFALQKKPQAVSERVCYTAAFQWRVWRCIERCCSQCIESSETEWTQKHPVGALDESNLRPAARFLVRTYVRTLQLPMTNSWPTATLHYEEIKRSNLDSTTFTSTAVGYRALRTVTHIIVFFISAILVFTDVLIKWPSGSVLVRVLDTLVRT